MEKIIFTEEQVTSLISFIEDRLSDRSCDHSLKFALQWAKKNGFDTDDLIDILEANGGFCDCEVVLNLPEDTDISLDATPGSIDTKNAWKIPPSFILPDKDKLFSKVLVSSHSDEDKWYAKEGEWLVPAPKNAKPKKRIRKSIHFFVGIESGLPNEYGFIKSCEPITAQEFAKKVRDGGQNDLKLFGTREAAFFLGRLEKLKEKYAVGTDFFSILGMSMEKREELRIR